MENKTPNFNRQKFLIVFIKYAGGQLTKMDFQKLLFLYHRTSNTTYYDFIPYNYGCYSFQASSDLEILQNQGWITIGEREIKLTIKTEIHFEKNINNLSALKSFMAECHNLRGDKLVKTIYKRYPYYAIHSKISRRVLNEDDLQVIQKEKESYLNTQPTLFTIGYEGISFETYVNLLIQNNVCLLCDVRNNPLSRKFGFSKNMLSSVLPKIGIDYIHIPELGIVSSKRNHLEGVNDYKILFDEYLETLSEKKVYLEQIIKLLKKYSRISLTCFEKEIKNCHRYYLSRFLEHEYNIKVVDL